MKKYTDDQLYKIYEKQLEKSYKQLEEKESRINARREEYNKRRQYQMPLIDKANKVIKLSIEEFLETLEEDKIKNDEKTETSIARDIAKHQTKLYSVWGQDSSFKIASSLIGSLKELKKQNQEFYNESIANQEIFDKRGNINYFKLASSIANAKFDALEAYNEILKENGVKNSHDRAKAIHDLFFYGSP